MESHYRKIFNNKKKEKSVYKNREKMIKFEKIKIVSKSKFIFNILILNCIIILFPFSLAKFIHRSLMAANQITLKINTKGLVQILNNNFALNPSSVIVNGETTSLINKKINLTSTSNNVIMKFSSSITNCSYMFRDLTNISEIDLSSFISSSIIDMKYMFYGCTKLTKIIFSDITISNIKYMNYTFYNCISLVSLDLSNFKTSQVNSMAYMFYNCSSLQSLDLSNFKTSQVNSMAYMFYNCKTLRILKLGEFSNTLITNMQGIFQNCTSLESLDLSTFFTPKAQILWDMFKGCKSLRSLDLSTFDTSKVTDMESMFEGCESLVSLNLNHFQTSKVKYMNKMFRYCYNLEYVYMKKIRIYSSLTMQDMFYKCTKLKYINLYSIDLDANNIGNMFYQTSGNFTFCIEDETKITKIFNLLLGLTQTKRDCSDNCYLQNKYYNSVQKKCILDCNSNDIDKYSYNYTCYNSCPKRTNHKSDNFTCEDLNCNYLYNFEQTDCITQIEDGYFVNSSSLKTIDKCHENCKTCLQKGTTNNENCITCPVGKFLYFGNCVNNCSNGYYTDSQDNSIKICKCSNIKCLSCNQESLENDLCISCNENYYPLKDDPSNNGTYINCYKSKEGYYLDKNDSYFKACFNTCKTCNELGNELDNKCQTCNDMYQFLDEYPDNHNCYKKCQFYYFFDNKTNYFCTSSQECPQDYKYLFRKQCFNECPPNTILSDKNNSYCKIVCPKEYPFEIVESQECVENCDLNDRKLKLCIHNYIDENKTENENFQNQTLSDIHAYITNSDNLSNIEFNLTEKTKDNEISFSITKTESSNDGKKNELTLNLGPCEDKLRNYYQIPKSEPLYIFQIKVTEKGIQAAKVEYEVYYPLNGKYLEKLELNICQNTNVEISNTVNINAKDLDKHNPKSGFYNDICYIYTSDRGTDFSLEDRKNQYIEKNYSLCEENCDLKDYDDETKKAVCSCLIKIKLPLISEISIDKNRLKESFSNITNIANFKVMKCFKVLFTKQGILFNIGCYIMLPIILLHFISVIIFYNKDFKELKIIIKKIIYIKKNWKSINLKLKSRDENQSEKKETTRKSSKRATDLGKKKENMATKISDKIINKNQNKRKINNIDNKNINKGINSERFNFKKENEAKKITIIIKIIKSKKIMLYLKI